MAILPCPAAGCSWYVPQIRSHTDRLNPKFELDSVSVWAWNPRSFSLETEFPMPQNIGMPSKEIRWIVNSYRMLGGITS